MSYVRQREFRCRKKIFAFDSDLVPKLVGFPDGTEEARENVVIPWELQAMCAETTQTGSKAGS